jgi:hypothetical protein
LDLVVVTPIHPARYPALVTIVTTNVRTPIIAVPPAIIPIRTMGITVVAVGRNIHGDMHAYGRQQCSRVLAVAR